MLSVILRRHPSPEKREKMEMIGCVTLVAVIFVAILQLI
jgi:hypothetical protein